MVGTGVCCMVVVVAKVWCGLLVNGHGDLRVDLILWLGIVWVCTVWDLTLQVFVFVCLDVWGIWLVFLCYLCVDWF